MRLLRTAREFYALSITTDPVLSGGWEASFDGGTTWHAGEAATVGTTPVVRWLVAGPSAPVDETPVAATLTRSVSPLLRAIEDPEVVVRGGPQIALG